MVNNPSDFYPTVTALGRLLIKEWDSASGLDFWTDLKAYPKYYRIDKILRKATVGQLRRISRSGRRCQRRHAKIVLRFFLYHAIASYGLAEYYRTDFKDDPWAEESVDFHLCDYINNLSLSWKFARLTRIDRGWYERELDCWIRDFWLRKNEEGLLK